MNNSRMKNGWLKSRGLALGCLLLGGALAMFASAQPWWGGLGQGAAVKFTGTQATGGLSQALAIATLAGTLLMLVLRSRGRRVLGTVLLLIGLGVALVGGLWRQPRPDAIRGQLDNAGVSDTFRLTETPWPWIFVMTGVLITAGAALTVITAGNWPSADRFEPESGKAPLTTADEPIELWKAMDAGVDPTARDAQAAEQADDHDTRAVSDPKVRDRRAGDTMDGTEQAQRLPRAPTSHSSGHVRQGRGDREA